MMKHFFILWFVFALLPMVCTAQNRDEECINLHYPGHHGTHYDLPMPADEPEAYYNDDNQEVIIYGTGYVSYYDVEIASAATLTVLISTQINGSYDTIDVSSLPSDHVYVITIYSPTGNTFEGFFEIE